MECVVFLWDPRESQMLETFSGARTPAYGSAPVQMKISELNASAEQTACISDACRVKHMELSVCPKPRSPSINKPTSIVPQYHYFSLATLIFWPYVKAILREHVCVCVTKMF